jgi:hypothetical protein
VLALTTLLASMDLFVMPRRPTRHNPDCARGPCRALPLGGTCAAPFGSVRAKLREPGDGRLYSDVASPRAGAQVAFAGPISYLTGASALVISQPKSWE